MKVPFVCLLIFSIGIMTAYAQQSPLAQLSDRPLSFLKDYAANAEKIAARLREKSEKTLQKMKNAEMRLAKKLMKKDSAAGQKMAAQLEERYNRYARILSDSGATDPLRSYYVSGLDSAGVALRLVRSIGLSPAQQQLAASMQARLGLLQEGVTRTNLLQQELSDRVRELRGQLSGLPGLRDLAKITKTVAYYKATLNEYKALLANPDRLMAKMLTLLSQTKIFKQFFERYSLLSAILPPSPLNLADPLQTGTLQVRNAVMNAVGQSGNNVNIIQTLRQQASATPNPLQAIKDKVMALKQDKNLEEPTDKVPNNQRTKTFMQRLELGTNFQTVKSNNYFPTTSDLALSVGFRINDKSIIGVGAAYKLGWGKDFRHIKITHEGIGLRSFVNAKIIGSFSATGGYELNYQQPFADLQALPDMRQWRKSGLVGVSKTVDLKTKVLKKTQVQVLLDLLAFNTSYPRIMVRVGYQFH